MVGYADYDVLGCFAHGYFDWGRGFRRVVFVVVDDGLDGVAKEFTDNVFEMGEDVGEGGGEVTGEIDCWEEGFGWEVGGYGCGDAGDDRGRRAFEEDFADEIGVVGRGVRGLGKGEGEGEVLFGYHAAGDALN